MNLKDYLNSHTIIEIGRVLSEYLCLETIVDDPIELINNIDESEYYISVIRWWDRVKIGTSSPIGYGGPRDPRDPEVYYFAETYLEESFEASFNKDEFLTYLSETKEKYRELDLYPAFDIMKKPT